jgi:3'-5' exoribonuclease
VPFVSFVDEKTMSKTKPPTVLLSDLVPGHIGDCFALLVERTRGARRDGKPYYTCRFRDARRTATYMVWADGPWFDACEEGWQQGQFYKLRCTFEEHKNYGPQIELHNIRPITDADKTDGFDPLQFVEHSRFDPEAMFAELCALAEENIADEQLRKLVLTILDRSAGQLKQLPATQNRFHPFAGGLLEHTLSVAHTCLFLADKYLEHYPDLKPPLNRDLIVAGAILHDMGRTQEFGDDLLDARPTVPGRLFGHLFLGRDLVRDTAREIEGINPEIVQLLEHIVITHLAIPEWGSPKLPAIPECLIIHHADDLDAKLEMYARCLTKDKEAGPFTARDPSLGRQLFKGRSV